MDDTQKFLRDHNNRRSPHHAPIVELSHTDKYLERIKLLRSIPGVGILTGMEILVELQDFARFKTSEQIASYLGLTPSEYSTGQ